MKEEIIKNINKPIELEELYRTDSAEFYRNFNNSYNEIKNEPASEFWLTKLKYDNLFRFMQEI